MLMFRVCNCRAFAETEAGDSEGGLQVRRFYIRSMEWLRHGSFWGWGLKIR